MQLVGAEFGPWRCGDAHAFGRARQVAHSRSGPRTLGDCAIGDDFAQCALGVRWHTVRQRAGRCGRRHTLRRIEDNVSVSARVPIRAAHVEQKRVATIGSRSASLIQAGFSRVPALSRRVVHGIARRFRFAARGDRAAVRSQPPLRALASAYSRDATRRASLIHPRRCGVARFRSSKLQQRRRVAIE